MKPFSYHVHTEFCDAKSTAEEMVLAAIAKGFDSIGFSGHSYIAEEICASKDCDTLGPAKTVPRSDDLMLYGMSRINTELYRAMVLYLADRYKDKINIYLGLEKDSFAVLDDVPLNLAYVIGSVHYVKPEEGQFIAVDYTPETIQKAVEKFYGGDYLAYAEAYYKEVEKVYDKTVCDIVGHLDLITKFNEKVPLIDVDHPRYRNAALTAAEKLARHGLIFEINTGAMGRGYKTKPYLDEEILRVIRESGGKVTYSSDCHHADHIAVGFEEAIALAKRSGFKGFMKFHGRGFYEEEF